MFLFGCGGQSGGLAPSNISLLPITTTDVSNDSTIKYGESVALTNGWEMSIDTTDPVEQVVLVASGWSVEVKYE